MRKSIIICFFKDPKYKYKDKYTDIQNGKRKYDIFLDIWGLKYPKALVPKYICTQLHYAGPCLQVPGSTVTTAKTLECGKGWISADAGVSSSSGRKSSSIRERLNTQLLIISDATGNALWVRIALLMMLMISVKDTMIRNNYYPSHHYLLLVHIFTYV